MLSKKEKTRLAAYKRYLKKSHLLYSGFTEKSGEEQEIMREVSVSVLAPSMAGFVIWTLQQSIKNGIKRLYFLARDGYFMYQMASVFCKELNLPIECRYLCCSRYSVRIPMFYMDMDEALAYICRGGIDVTIMKILDRAGIGTEKRTEVL